MGQAHNIRVLTENKYDIVDALEMDPLRRRMLLASLYVQKEDADTAKNKKPPGKGVKR